MLIPIKNVSESKKDTRVMKNISFNDLSMFTADSSIKQISFDIQDGLVANDEYENDYECHFEYEFDTTSNSNSNSNSNNHSKHEDYKSNEEDDDDDSSDHQPYVIKRVSSARSFKSNKTNNSHSTVSINGSGSFKQSKSLSSLTVVPLQVPLVWSKQKRSFDDINPNPTAAGTGTGTVMKDPCDQTNSTVNYLYDASQITNENPDDRDRGRCFSSFLFLLL